MGITIINGTDINKVNVSCMYCGFNYGNIRRNLSWLIELHQLFCEREPDIMLGENKLDLLNIPCTGGLPANE